MSDFLYFDNHTATRPFPDALESFFKLSKEYWASATSPHFLGQQQQYPLQKSIKNIFEDLGASDGDHLLCSSSAKEAIEKVFSMTYFEKSRDLGKTLFLHGQTEAEDIRNASRKLELLGCISREIPVNDKGQITAELLEKALTPRTALFSISWANGLTGVIHPIEDLAGICKTRGVLFHVDASYVFGKSFFRFQDIGADFLTLDGSVMHSPSQMSLTVLKEGLFEHIEASTPGSVPAIFTLSQTLEALQDKFELYCMEIVRLRDLFEEKVCEFCKGAEVLFKNVDRLPNSSVIAFPPVFAESLLFFLNTKGIYASCGGGKFLKLPYVLEKSGIDPKKARSAISFSFSYDFTEEQVLYAAKLISQCVEILQRAEGGILDE